MSYDLMVFDAADAPKGRTLFLDWYKDQTQWAETHGYNDPEVSTTALRAWFQDMVKSFPPMNGLLASKDVDDLKITDYCIGRLVIYAAFAWSHAASAYQLTTRFAAKHRVGFFDASSVERDIWLPCADEGLEKQIE